MMHDDRCSNKTAVSPAREVADPLPAAPLPNTQQPAAGVAVSSLAFAVLLPALGSSISNVALPVLADSFAGSSLPVQWVVVSYLLALVSCIVGAGVLGDSFGHKRLLVAGLSLFSIASMLCVLSTGWWWLLLGRLLQGVGASAILAQSLVLLRSAAAVNQLGAAMGLFSSAAAIGTALGPVLAGLLLTFFDWRSIFCLLFGLGGLGVLLCANYVAADVATDVSEQPQPQPFDGLGAMLLALTSLWYALGCSGVVLADMLPASASQLVHAVLPAMVVDTVCWWLALLSFSVFVLRQRTSRYPLINLAFFQEKRRNLSLLAGFLVDAVAMATLVLGPFYLSDALGLPAWQVGLLLSVGPLAAACSGYPAGKLADRFGPARMMRTGLLLMVMGVCCFAWFPLLFGVYGYVAALLLMTPGRQLFLTSNQAVVMQHASGFGPAMVAGLLQLSKNLGLLTGASVLPAIFSLQLAPLSLAAASPIQLEAAFNRTFLLAALALMLIWLVMLLLNRQAQQLDTLPGD